jgi:hypothetical protein
VGKSIFLGLELLERALDGVERLRTSLERWLAGEMAGADPGGSAPQP